MAQPKLEDLVELAKAAQAWLKRAALASADAVKKWSQQVPDWETAQRSMRGAGTAIAQRLQSVHLEVFDLQDPQQVSSAEEFFYACKSLGLHSARELSKLPSTSAVVLFLLFLRGALVTTVRLLQMSNETKTHRNSVSRPRIRRQCQFGWWKTCQFHQWERHFSL
ncbi:unnamed protein product [Durusdinium trenchii]|uniref:Uncharacterized protein n=1 Tax=Durusdinium trenchii TaxID=1381693 RepID=A0ABP0PW48_9DINO